ncbi:hypothetical protein D019_2346 [Vibrio parahaemolyticus VP2007-095]|nr:hypothetical protein D019_2346 [Vibrio parahaemolyticus VP2007-095]
MPHNAALRGAGTHYKRNRITPQSLNKLQTKNATRAKSRLNALLYSPPFSFNLPPKKSRTSSECCHKQIT